MDIADIAQVTCTEHMALSTCTAHGCWASVLRPSHSVSPETRTPTVVVKHQSVAGAGQVALPHLQVNSLGITCVGCWKPTASMRTKEELRQVKVGAGQVFGASTDIDITFLWQMRGHATVSSLATHQGVTPRPCMCAEGELRCDRKGGIWAGLPGFQGH